MVKNGAFMDVFREVVELCGATAANSLHAAQASAALGESYRERKTTRGCAWQRECVGSGASGALGSRVCPRDRAALLHRRYFVAAPMHRPIQSFYGIPRFARFLYALEDAACNRGFG